jgi:DNA repair protein SbcD/Mre11
VVRIAIAADLHVDDFGTTIDASTGWNARFEDGIAATRFVATTARELGAHALVIAGDYTEKRSPSPPRVARIREALLEGPRQIHVRGNHDLERSGRSIVDLLGQTRGWEGFTTPGISLVGGVAVCAIPFLGPSYLRAQPSFEAASPADVYRALGEAYLTIARGLFAQATEAGAEAAILVGHQQLAGGRMNDSQAAFLGDMDLVVDSRALASIGYAAVIFGHVHRAQTVVDDPACPVLFAGSTHRVDFAEELEDKSFLFVDVEEGRVTINPHPIPARRFVTLAGADIEAGVDAGQVEDAVVRVRDLDPMWDVAALRRELEAAGAFEVQSIAVRRVDAPAATGGMAEGLTAPEALSQYFDGDPDAEVLVERGRGILAEVVG